jgi:hypothetical protein
LPSATRTTTPARGAPSPSPRRSSSAATSSTPCPRGSTGSATTACGHPPTGRPCGRSSSLSRHRSGPGRSRRLPTSPVRNPTPPAQGHARPAGACIDMSRSWFRASRRSRDPKHGGTPHERHGQRTSSLIFARRIRTAIRRRHRLPASAKYARSRAVRRHPLPHRRACRPCDFRHGPLW